MNEKENGFSKDELKRGVDKIADCTKRSSYSDQQSVERVRDLGKELIDNPPGKR